MAPANVPEFYNLQNIENLSEQMLFNAVPIFAHFFTKISLNHMYGDHHSVHMGNHCNATEAWIYQSVG